MLSLRTVFSHQQVFTDGFHVQVTTIIHVEGGKAVFVNSVQSMGDAKKC